MWGSVRMILAVFFVQHCWSTRDAAGPTRSVARLTGRAHPMHFKRGDVTSKRPFWGGGGGANKEVIKHLFLRRNKKKHTHMHTHTHFGVFVLPQQKLSAALILTKKKKTLHFSSVSRLFFRGPSATACDADGSLSRLLGVPPREQLLQLTVGVRTAPRSPCRRSPLGF